MTLNDSSENVHRKVSTTKNSTDAVTHEQHRFEHHGNTAVATPLRACLHLTRTPEQYPLPNLPTSEKQPKQPTKANMTKIAIVYYSTYGHVVQLADAIKEGIESVEGVTAELYQVAETLPEKVLAKMHAPPKKDHPIATPGVLKEADGILFGLPTRFGSFPAQIKAFFDSTGSLWQAGALIGKPAGVFFTTGVQGGGQETTAYTALTFLSQHGMTYVPLGYRSPLMFSNDEIHGGSPWGAGAIAGADGSRQASKLELDVARVQGESFAQVAKKLSA
ncbi:Nad quinone oxidoreductase, partial [Globisporangium splendens]